MADLPHSKPLENRLAKEKSPYLLQHKNNPVDWHPWGQEAFDKARQLNKPIFLSVGYSTCHWCHVMERESFENQEIANIMNECFVNIKVDREERPDVDRIYMSFVQATTGGGGWPMSVWLVPTTLKPFLGGTYYPPKSNYGRPGFPDICRRIQQLWKDRKQDVIESGDQVMKAIAEQEEKQSQAGAAGALDASEVLEALYQTLLRAFDPTWGGFSRAPKFPRPVVFTGLFAIYKLLGKENSLHMAEFTLEKMARGGMHDHLGGGFHRYSVTKEWLVPHFEKMLYDQGQLAMSYLEAYQLTKKGLYSSVARDILDYVLRQMTHPEGGFWSAEDADSPLAPGSHEKGEGACYIWSAEELDKLLSVEEALVVKSFYGVQKNGNVSPAGDPHQEFVGKNILMQTMSIEECASELNSTPEKVAELIASARPKLLAARDKKPPPHLDDKILVAWNALFIKSLAKAYQALGEEKYLTAATRAVDFIKAKMYKESEGLLIRNYREGPSSICGFADDYAFLISALIELYQASFNWKHLQWALQLQVKMDELFWDANDGGYFGVDGRDPSLILRSKEDYDGAEPSPNSYALENLCKLYQIFKIDDCHTKAHKLVDSLKSQLKESPYAAPYLATAFACLSKPPRQLVIAGTVGQPKVSEILSLVHSHYDPLLVVLLADASEGQRFLISKGLDYLSDGDMRIGGEVTAYVCQNFTCSLPTSELAKVNELLGYNKGSV